MWKIQIIPITTVNLALTSKGIWWRQKRLVFHAMLRASDGCRDLLRVVEDGERHVHTNSDHMALRRGEEASFA